MIAPDLFASGAEIGGILGAVVLGAVMGIDAIQEARAKRRGAVGQLTSRAEAREQVRVLNAQSAAVSPSRVAAGTASGGQFAARARRDGDVKLG